MTMANIGATSVPRGRVLRVWRGVFRAVAAGHPPGAGAREALGAGGNRQNPANPQLAPDARLQRRHPRFHPASRPVSIRSACENWPSRHIYFVSFLLLC
jgi:hypothetical protein